MKKAILLLCFEVAIVSSNGCAVVTAPYHVTKDVVQGGVWVVKTTCEVTAGTTKIIYKIGEYTDELAVLWDREIPCI